MGKGGGSSAPTQQTVTQTNLPEYARPYFENLMQRAQAESYREYTPYQAERIAPFAPAQTAAQQASMNLQQPGQFGTASGFGTAAGLGALGASQYQPGQFATQQILSPALMQYQMQQPEAFGGAQAQQYMSPYMQQVVDVSKRKAIEDAQKTQLAQNLAAARTGTYGGARQLLAATEREKALGTQLGDIQARGLESAFGQAQQQFERDRAAQMQAGRANLEALLGVQQTGSQQAMQAGLANQQQFLEAQRLAEQSRQYGAGLGMQGTQAAIQAAQALGQLGVQQQASDIERIKAMSAAGAEQQAMRQKMLDQAYADFLRQRDYPMEQLGYFGNLMRGIPVGLSSTQTSYAAPPSLASQIGGLGLAGLGLYNLAGRG